MKRKASYLFFIFSMIFSLQSSGAIRCIGQTWHVVTTFQDGTTVEHDQIVTTCYNITDNISEGNTGGGLTTGGGGSSTIPDDDPDDCADIYGSRQYQIGLTFNVLHTGGQWPFEKLRYELLYKNLYFEMAAHVENNPDLDDTISLKLEIDGPGMNYERTVNDTSLTHTGQFWAKYLANMGTLDYDRFTWTMEASSPYCSYLSTSETGDFSMYGLGSKYERISNWFDGELLGFYEPRALIPCQPQVLYNHQTGKINFTETYNFGCSLPTFLEIVAKFGFNYGTTEEVWGYVNVPASSDFKYRVTIQERRMFAQFAETEYDENGEQSRNTFTIDRTDDEWGVVKTTIPCSTP